MTHQTAVFASPASGKLRLAAWRVVGNVQSRLGGFPGSWRLSMLKAKILGQNKYVPVKYLRDYTVWICPKHVMDRDVARGKVHEPEVQRLLSGFVRAGYSYFDIGANIGLHLIPAASNRVSDSQVFVAVEPEPTLFSLLERNLICNSLGFVQAHRCGLGDSCLRTQLYLSAGDNKGEHSLFADQPGQPMVEVDIVTLDHLCQGIGRDVTESSLLFKIDTEGSEPLVLAGGREVLSSPKELALVIEVHPAHLLRAGHSPQELLSVLEELGCRLFQLDIKGKADPKDGFYLDGDKGEDWYANVLAVRGEQTLSLVDKLLVPVRSGRLGAQG